MPKRPWTPEDLYRIREAADPQLARTGDIAFVVQGADRDEDENRSSIWVVRPGSEPVRLTQGKKDAAPRWSPDGATIAFLRPDDDGKMQAWLLPASGGEARKLTSLPLGVSGLDWSPDGSKLSILGPVDIAGTPEDEGERAKRAHAPRVITTTMYKADGAGLLGDLRVHLFVVDIETGESTPLTKDDINASAPAWSRDSRSIAFSATTGEDRDVWFRSHLFVVDAQGGDLSEIAQWEGTANTPAYAPDGRTILFTGQEGPGVGHAKLFTVDADGGKPSRIFDAFDRNVMVGGPGYPGARPRFLDDGRILFCARDRGCTQIYVGEGSNVTKIVGGDDRVCSSVSASGDRIAYLVSDPQIPSDVFIANTDGSNEQRLTALNAELLDEVAVRVPQPRMFEASDGTPIHGWLIEGDGAGRKPLLLDVHGGPHNAWNPAFLAGAHGYIEALASRGWNVLILNPRGSDGYGEDFFTAVVGAWGESDEQDFLAAIDDLVAEGIADPSRLAVCGYSYGGYMSAWLSARTDRFAAAIPGGCVTDKVSIHGTSDLGWYIGAFEVGAELHESRDRYTAVSPLTYVEHVTAPTLLLHGENDNRCPIGQAEQWYGALRRMGVEVELVRYPGASHLFILNGRPSHRVDYSQRIVDWLEGHIG